MDIFSSREIAVGIWGGVIVVLVFTGRATREASWAVIRLASRPKLLVPVIVAGFYTWLVVVVLARLGLWTPTELKDTIIWFVFAGATMIFRGVSSHRPDSAIKGIVWDAIKITVFVEFLLNFYSFPLWVEMLFLPLATLVGCLLVVADTEKKFSTAASCLRGIEAFIGLLFIAFTFWLFVHNANALWSGDTVRALVLPVALSVAIVPLAYCMAVIAAYEQLFISLNWSKASFWVRQYAKLKLWWALRFSLRKVRIARRRFGFRMGEVVTADDVRHTVARLDTRTPAQPSATANKASFYAGYRAGYRSAGLEWEAKVEIDRECDAEIAANGYDRKSFDEGFVAGTEDADIEGTANS